MAARLMAITSLNTCGGPNHASPPEIDEPVTVEFIAFIGISAKALGSGLRHLAFCARFRGHISELVVQVDWVAGWVIWALTLEVDHGLSSSISPSLDDISAWIPPKRSGY